MLSILSTLTSGPLVIQRQVKALRRLCSSGSSDVYAESGLKLPFSAAMFYPLFFLGLIMVGRFVIYEMMPNPPLDPVGIVILGIGVLYFMVSVFCLMALGAWLFYYLHYLGSLFFSALYRELP